MITVGIDPGKQGSAVILYDDKSLSFFDLSDCYDKTGAAQVSMNPLIFGKWVFRALGGRSDDVLVCCEKPIFIGGITVKTPMSMFESYGVIRSVCSCAGFIFGGVDPKDWIRYYPDLWHPREKRVKEESVDKAIELFPEYRDVFKGKIEKGRSKGNVIVYDGRAEAALIANYARNNSSLFNQS